MQSVPSSIWSDMRCSVRLFEMRLTSRARAAHARAGRERPNLRNAVRCARRPRACDLVRQVVGQTPHRREHQVARIASAVIGELLQALALAAIAISVVVGGQTNPKTKTNSSTAGGVQ